MTPAPSKYVQLEAATEAAALLVEEPEEPAFLLVRLYRLSVRYPPQISVSLPTHASEQFDEGSCVDKAER
jgi:hypothetical protein